MTVDKKELEDLQLYIQKNLRKISAQPKPDSTAIFDLQTLDSNVSFILSSSQMLKTEKIELGTRDKNVIDNLLQYRKDNYVTDGDNQFLSDIVFNAQEALFRINEALSLIKDCDNPVLSKNLEKAFGKASEALEHIKSLNENPRKFSKWSQEAVDDDEIIKPSKKTVKLTTEASVKSSTKSVSTKPTVKKTLAKKTSSKK